MIASDCEIRGLQNGMRWINAMMQEDAETIAELRTALAQAQAERDAAREDAMRFSLRLGVCTSVKMRMRELLGRALGFVPSGFRLRDEISDFLAAGGGEGGVSAVTTEDRI